MNFYIGNSIEDINPNERNVELCDELLEYLLNHKNDMDLRQSVLQEIDPYDDTLIEYSDLEIWQDMCSSIIGSNLLDNFEDKDEVKSIEELLDLIGEATCLKKNIIVIGD